MKHSSLHVKRITVCAVFLSIALVLKTAFSISIPLFGHNGMRIGVAGIFSMMPSILFGPVYGAIVSGLSDLLGYLLKPTGAYMPLMTLCVASGGFIRGGLWLILRDRNSRQMRTGIAVCSILLLIPGVCNIYFLAADGITMQYYDLVDPEAIDTERMHMIGRMLILRTMNTKNPAANLATFITCTTSGVIGCGGFGLFLLAADYFISRRFLHNAGHGQVPQLLIAMIVSGIIVTTINTVILRETIYQSWKLIPFAVIWIPRAIEEILGNTIKAYFIAMLLGVFNRQPGLRDLISGWGTSNHT